MVKVAKSKGMAPRLQESYYNKYKAQLKKELKLSSVMGVPFIEKIILNMGVGEAVKTPKILEGIQQELSLISGQAAVKTKARKSIATFKLRKGMPIGAMVTLRGIRMYEFLDRLVHIALPRVRDFNGLSLKSFDKNGNYTFGIKEQIIFPEIDFDKVGAVRGMNITLVICSKAIEHSIALLRKFEFPLREK